MPRDIPVGNGDMLVAFDTSYRIRDFYFPHVGQENHAGHRPFHFGVWVDGRMSWVHEARGIESCGMKRRRWSRRSSYATTRSGSSCVA